MVTYKTLQHLKTYLFCKYWHQSQHYFSTLETLLMRSTNAWYLLTYLLIDDKMLLQTSSIDRWSRSSDTSFFWTTLVISMTYVLYRTLHWMLVAGTTLPPERELQLRYRRAPQCLLPVRWRHCWTDAQLLRPGLFASTTPHSRVAQQTVVSSWLYQTVPMRWPIIRPAYLPPLLATPVKSP